MNYALAPLEGITGYLFRNAHAVVFGPADTYLTPFLSPTMSGCFSHRELQDVLPEHNEELSIVPQLLTNNAGHFLWAARELEAMGYREVNLNLGCPSGTVTAKGKGSGFLAFPDQLDRFLDEIFSQTGLAISVKTRIGTADPEEFGPLLEIFNRYPISELTVHPRVRTDLYRGVPRLDAFQLAVERSRAPLRYNGDLFSPVDLTAFSARFPQVDRVMLGRGVIADPALIRELRGGPPARKGEIRQFHDRLYAGYRTVMPGPKPVLAKMKELWAYLLFSFTGREACARSLRKASRLDEYESAVDRLFRDQDVIPGGSFDPKSL